MDNSPDYSLEYSWLYGESQAIIYVGPRIGASNQATTKPSLNVKF